MPLKTSVYLNDDIVERWKATGVSLAELVRRGLDAGGPLPGLTPPMAATEINLALPDHVTQQVEALVESAQRVRDANLDVCHATEETGKAVNTATEQLGTLLGLLRDQGYVIVPKAELTAQLQSLMTMAASGLQAGDYRLVKIEQDDGAERRAAMTADIEERYGPGCETDSPAYAHLVSGAPEFEVHGTMTGHMDVAADAEAIRNLAADKAETDRKWAAVHPDVPGVSFAPGGVVGGPPFTHTTDDGREFRSDWEQPELPMRGGIEP
jgi:hypothetical protein